MVAICFAVGFAAGGSVSNILRIFPESFFTHVKTLILYNDYYLQFLSNNWLRAAPFWGLPIIAGSGAGFGAWLFFGRLIDPIVHVRGRRLWRGEKALEIAKAASKLACSAGGVGIEMLKGVHLSRDQEVKSILVCGAQGGGKTVVINTLLLQLLSRGDKLIIFDPVKGDYSRWVPMQKGRLCLFSSTDARTLHWYLGWDLLNESDAAAFAEGFVEAGSGDPMWANSARALMIGLIVHLQKTRGTDWSWPELVDLLKLGLAEMYDIFEQSYPPAMSFANPESKTAQSIEINLKAFVIPIYRLAQTWSKVDAKKRFSLVSWLKDDNAHDRNLIVQMNQRDSSIGASLGRAIVGLLTNHISSLEFGESKTRRFGFVLDEITQFRRLETIAKLMEIGRSKGIYAIFGFQDIAQINQIYAQYESSKWAALFGLRIFPQVVGAESQKWVCDQVGDREVRFLNKNVSGNGQSDNVNVSKGMSQPTTVPVLLPAELELFGKRADGIEALVLGIGKDALALKFPFPQIKNLRKPHIDWPDQLVNPTNHTGSFEAEPTNTATSNSGSEQPRNSAMELVQTEEVVVADVTPSATSDEQKSLDDAILNIIDQQNESADDKENEVETETEAVKNEVEHGLAEAAGVPEIALELLDFAEQMNQNDPNLQAESTSFQPTETKKRSRKPRAYASQQQE
jgi:hypothetical protein